VVDGGALQEVDPTLLNSNMIVTPNYKEMELLRGNIPSGVTVLEKGVVDKIYDGKEKVEIKGGNAGMTKGGTGDVLAGLVAGLYAKSSAMAACVVASRVNKNTGEELENKVGPFFSAGDLISELQTQLHLILSRELDKRTKK
jgi:NAD(P)H-hydrate epimerase